MRIYIRYLQYIYDTIPLLTYLTDCLSLSLSLSLCTDLLVCTALQVENGLECGLTLSGYSDFQEGDEIECLKVLWTAPTEVVLPGTSGTLRESTQAGTTTATSTTTVAATATGSSGGSSNNSNTTSSSSKKINQKM